MASKASPLLPLNLTAPGAFGLTGETSIAGDFQEWLFEANNAIFTNEGLVAPRRLFRIPDPTYWTLEFDSAGNYQPAYAAGRYFICGSAKIYTDRGDDLTALTYETGLQPDVWTGYKTWHCAHLNGKWFFFYEGEEPKVYDPLGDGGNGTFSKVDGAPEYGIIHSAFGRLWAASTSQTTPKLYWSLLLDGTDWASAGTGDLDLSSYLTEGEAITAISDFNGFLVVFTNKCVLIFQDPFLVPIDSSGTEGTVQSMSLKEQIRNTGCVGKNAVCNVGEELIFYAHNGLQRISRILQDGGSNPLGVLCPQAHTIFSRYLHSSVGSSQNLDWVRLNYHPPFNFLTLETSGVDGVYLIYLNRPVGKTGYAVTRWGYKAEDIANGLYGRTEITGLHHTGGWAGVGAGITAIIKVYDDANNLDYYGVAHYGMEAIEDVAETNGYDFTVKSAWLNFGDNPAGPVVKIPKDLEVIYRTPESPTPTYEGTTLDVDWKLRFDYSSTAFTHSFTTPLIERGFFDAGWQYSPHSITPVPLSGSGSLVQWEISATIDNRAHEAFAIQRAGFQSKLGRIHQGI